MKKFIIKLICAITLFIIALIFNLTGDTQQGIFFMLVVIFLMMKWDLE